MFFRKELSLKRQKFVSRDSWWCYHAWFVPDKKTVSICSSFLHICLQALAKDKSQERKLGRAWIICFLIIDIARREINACRAFPSAIEYTSANGIIRWNRHLPISTAHIYWCAKASCCLSMLTLPRLMILASSVFIRRASIAGFRYASLHRCILFGILIENSFLGTHKRREC